jgi:hypothetical protein
MAQVEIKSRQYLSHRYIEKSSVKRTDLVSMWHSVAPVFGHTPPYDFHASVLHAYLISVGDSPEGLSYRLILVVWRFVAQTSLRQFATLCTRVRLFVPCRF